MRKARSGIGVIVLTALITVTGCGSRADTAAAPATAVPVRLGYFPNLTHAQAVLAVGNGDFARAVSPSPFTARTFNAGPSVIEALFNEQIDIGYVGPGPVINGWVRSHGEGVRVVGGSAGSGVIIVARKGSGIRTMADLTGKKIATPQRGNTQDIAARHYVLGTLHAADTKNVLAIANADQAGLMSRGDIDASWAPEPWGSVLMRTTGATMVGEEKDLWPNKDFSLTVIVTTPAFLARHADLVADVLKVNADWTRKLNANGAQYAGPLDAELKMLTGKALPPGLTADALKRIHFTNEVIPGTFEANAQWATELGFARTTPDLTGMIEKPNVAAK